jgi:ABC-type Zn uptake system ZnuABC Zn-binding protein ZnuA
MRLQSKSPRFWQPFLAILMLAVGWVGCSPSPGSQTPGGASAVVYLATIKPVGQILKELTEGRAEVHVLLPAAASAHTYEPLPSDARRAAQAKALFHVGPNLDDWVARLAARQKVGLLELVPEQSRLYLEGDGCTAHGHDHAHHHHHHGETVVDPHFWTDPLVVKQIVPALVERLSLLDPAGAETYRANGDRFMAELDALDASLRAELGPVRGGKVVMFHPSFHYLLARYELEPVGVVEPSPGKEATPRYLQELATRLRQENVRVVFTEPQLNPRPAQALAREAGVAVAVLDPQGALEGMDSYGDFLLLNAKSLRDALSATP